MAIKKPLVISSTGEIEQLQAGDTVDTGVVNNQSFTAFNNAGNDISKGSAVFIEGPSSITLGSKTWSIDEARIIGLVEDDIISDQTTGNILTDGILTQTDWSIVTGTPSLTPGATYFLGAGYGSITTDIPTTGYLTKLGTAISTTTLEVSITSPIKL